jgi:predicted amidohydrolase
MRVALCQANCGADVAANERQVFGLLDEAAEARPDLIALPEVWPCQGSAPQMRAAAEPLDGPRVSRLAEEARRRSVWVQGGSVLELDGERVFNTSVLFDRQGELVATYRKIHLFDADPPGGVPSRESFLFSAGDQVVTAETEFGRVGLTICYDLRFPELYRQLVVQGATILFAPAAFRHETGRDHWDVLVRARAIEDQAFVIGANQVGEAPPHYRSYGRSAIVDPWGVVLAQAPDEECFVAADLDLDLQDRVRATLPSLANRRPESYRWPDAAPVP